ncbi:hypothetical protein [Saccharospirillum mangrovi]|uniref:hypothetical protein n=1 Tax=Saccharospirillum mangrovi TaxID=2161747 RepID=UPI000E2069B9|nr:hypothetical protein [Saccharospirillum mangrovi]
MNPNVQRMAIAAISLFMMAQFGAQFAQSPLQLLIGFAAVGLVLGFLFRTGHRYLISGYAFGLVAMMLMDFIIGGALVKVTGPVYVAGYLFASAAGISIRFLCFQLPAYWAARKSRTS